MIINHTFDITRNMDFKHLPFSKAWAFKNFYGLRRCSNIRIDVVTKMSIKHFYT